MSHALKALGFQVRELAGRVVWGVGNDAPKPRAHVLLHVTVDGQPYIADAGFGSRTLTGTLRIETNIEQPSPHEPFRLLDARDDFLVRLKTELRLSPEETIAAVDQGGLAPARMVEIPALSLRCHVCAGKLRAARSSSIRQ